MESQGTQYEYIQKVHQQLKALQTLEEPTAVLTQRVADWLQWIHGFLWNSLHEEDPQAMDMALSSLFYNSVLFGMVLYEHHIAIVRKDEAPDLLVYPFADLIDIYNERLASIAGRAIVFWVFHVVCSSSYSLLLNTMDHSVNRIKTAHVWFILTGLIVGQVAAEYSTPVWGALEET